MRLLPILALVASLAACSSADELGVGVGERSASELRAVPTTAQLSSRPLKLETYLWRDFMPGPEASAAGSTLIGVLNIEAADAGSYPAGVRADAAWVVNGDQVWRADVRYEQGTQPVNGVLTVVIRGGPRWGPGIDVDVVVRLRDAAGGTAMLRAPAQRIHQTS